MSVQRDSVLMVGYWFKNDEILESLKKWFDDEFLENWEGCHAYLAETFAENHGKEGLYSISFNDGEIHFIGYKLSNDVEYTEHLNEVNKLSIQLMEDLNREEKPLISANINVY